MKIDDNYSLNLLLQNKKLSDIEFHISHLTEEENKMWQKKIKKDYYACGCQTGTVFLLAGIIFIGSYFIWELIHNPLFQLHASLIFYSVLILFIISAIGKSIGLFISSARLKKNVHFLIQTYI